MDVQELIDLIERATGLRLMHYRQIDYGGPTGVTEAVGPDELREEPAVIDLDRWRAARQVALREGWDFLRQRSRMASRGERYDLARFRPVRGLETGYHTTHQSRVEAIRREGLRPNRGEMKVGGRMDHVDNIYVSRCMGSPDDDLTDESAFAWIKKKSAEDQKPIGEWVIFEVDLSGLDEALMFEDFWSRGVAITLIDPIPRERLRLRHPTNGSK